MHPPARARAIASPGPVFKPGAAGDDGVLARGKSVVAVAERPPREGRALPPEHAADAREVPEAVVRVFDAERGV